MNMIKLSELDCGKKAKIIEVYGDSGIVKRFKELGFAKGSVVECLLQRKNSLKAFSVKGRIIAARPKDLNFIQGQVLTDGE